MRDISEQINTINSRLEEFMKSHDVNKDALKDQNGKIDYSEVDFDILDLMAKRFADNKHKYPKGNMLKPIDEKKLMFALFRHWKKILKPVEGDPETFEDHIAAIMCNAQMIWQQRKLKEDATKNS